MGRLNLALKVAIIASGKKQKRIAKLARVDEQQLSHYVHRRRRLSEDEADRLCAVLDKPRTELFDESDIAPTEQAMSA